MRPPVSIEIYEGNFSQVLFEKVRFLKRPNFLPLFEMKYLNESVYLTAGWIAKIKGSKKFTTLFYNQVRTK